MARLSVLFVLAMAVCLSACGKPDKKNTTEPEPCTACSACKEAPAEEEAHDPITIETVWLKVDGMTKVQGIT